MSQQTQPVSPRPEDPGALAPLDRWLLLFSFFALVGAVILASIAGIQQQTVALAGVALAAFLALILSIIAIGLVVYRVRLAQKHDTGGRPTLFSYLVLAGLPFLVLIAGVVTYWLINRD